MLGLAVQDSGASDLPGIRGVKRLDKKRFLGFAFRVQGLGCVALRFWV